MAGPPKKPLEERRRLGRSPGRDSGGRKLPAPDNVIPLRGIEGDAPPPLPHSLKPDGVGAERWDRIWRDARWLSIDTDIDVVTRLCEAEDQRQAMKEALAETGFFIEGSQGQKRPNPLLAQGRAVGADILKLERECGLTPSSRGSLGVGEVKAPDASPLDELLKMAANRHTGRRAAGNGS